MWLSLALRKTEQFEAMHRQLLGKLVLQAFRTQLVAASLGKLESLALETLPAIKVMRVTAIATGKMMVQTKLRSLLAPEKLCLSCWLNRTIHDLDSLMRELKKTACLLAYDEDEGSDVAHKRAVVV